MKIDFPSSSFSEIKIFQYKLMGVLSPNLNLMDHWAILPAYANLA